MISVMLCLLLMSSMCSATQVSSLTHAHRKTGGVVYAPNVQCLQSASIFGRYSARSWDLGLYGVTVCVILSTRIDVACVDVLYDTTDADSTAAVLTTTRFPGDIFQAEHTLNGYGPATSHTCALLTDSTVFCMGSNSNGQLGLGDRVERSSPTQVAFGSGDVPVSISLLYDTSCTLPFDVNFDFSQDSYSSVLHMREIVVYVTLLRTLSDQIIKILQPSGKLIRMSLLPRLSYKLSLRPFLALARGHLTSILNPHQKLLLLLSARSWQ